jgi:hypothetical protein
MILKLTTNDKARTHRVVSAAIGIGAVLRPPITIAMKFGCPAIET